MSDITNRFKSIGEIDIINDCYTYGNRPLSDHQENGIDIDASDSKIMLREFYKVRKKLEKVLRKEECLPFKIVESNAEELQHLKNQLEDIDKRVLHGNATSHDIKNSHKIKTKIKQFEMGFELINNSLMKLLIDMVNYSNGYVCGHYGLDVFSVMFYQEAKSSNMIDTLIFFSPTFLTKEQAVAINDFVVKLREKVRSKDYRKLVNDLNFANKRTFKSGANLVNTLFDIHSRLMVVRVDLAYSSKNMGGSLTERDLSWRDINLNKVNQDREKFFNSIRQTSIGKFLVGYIWKLEYGEDKGFHYHMIFFFDGSKVHKDAHYADEIGKYWNQITGGIGCHFNCNRAKSEYKRLGIGMINHNDTELRDNLVWRVLAYLVKKDQLIRPDVGNHRTFGRSEIPKPKSPSGRPRKEREEVASSNSVTTASIDTLTAINDLRHKLFLDLHIINFDLKPGDLGYFKLVKEFMPLRIPLGIVHEDEDEAASATWEPSKESNGFFLILGSSGSGKTETLKKIGCELVRHAIPVLVFDFHGDVIFPYVDSILMSSGRESTIGINPLDIPFDFSGKIGSEDQRNALVSMFARAIPQMGHNQRYILQKAIEEAYRFVGIFDDEPDTWSKPAPTMSLVIGILEAWLSDESAEFNPSSLRSCITIVNVLFGHAIFQRRKTLSIKQILSANTRIDLSSVVDDSIRFVVTETLLRMIFDELRRQGPIPVHPADDSERFRLFVIIDEAKILAMGKGDPNGKDRILNVLATEGRKFGIGLILASQMSSHFSDEVKGNMSARLVLKPMNHNEAKPNARDIQVSLEKVARLEGKGDGYYRCNANNGTVRIKVDPLRVITVDDDY